MPSTLTISYKGNPKVLTQITEGGNQSVYLLRTSTEEFRATVRHSKEKASGTAVALDRHNYEISVRTFPTAALPLGKTESAYVVVRSYPDSDGADAIALLDTLADSAISHDAALVGWQTTF